MKRSRKLIGDGWLQLGNRMRDNVASKVQVKRSQKSNKKCKCENKQILRLRFLCFVKVGHLRNLNEFSTLLQYTSEPALGARKPQQLEEHIEET